MTRVLDRRDIDRRIAALAVPALGALIAEPLFLAIDSALIGHLGAVPLAGLAIASAILTTLIGLMIFLAYSATPIVARLRGAGDERGAVQAGIDGLWLALGLGVVLGVLLWITSPALISLFGADAQVADQARIYLVISAAGMPAMLLVFAATGLLRGLHDTVTPLKIAGFGFAANALLNWVLIYGAHLGIAGSAWGTVISQWAMVLWYLWVISRRISATGASMRPRLGGLQAAFRSGGWLFIRTLGLRAALLATVFAASSHGAVATAGYQVMFIFVSITAFALDALAIAAQALIGDALGASDPDRARFVLRRTMFWGVIVGAITGGIIAALSPWIGYLFTNDAALLALLPPAIAIVGFTLPLAGLVYVLDGVLIGAGDTRYLAIVSIGALTVYLPALWAITEFIHEDRPALIALTLTFTLLLMLVRFATLALRARGGRWIVLGDRR